MSTPSDPSATTTTNGGNNASNQTAKVMLNKYLANEPTITEHLAFPGPAKGMKKVVVERRRKSGEFIAKWEAEWERMG